ncbi:hypothetical protein EYC55_15850 [Xanthomonas oryzae]|nr:hypothetical protein C7T79_19545 [Xanthomonas oryzae pv. oryzicola]QBG94104.1 hypothetical protein EYR26_15840 [Xanthomonas oryzae]QBG98028.1 hypothetical protein EYC55_15850 [Xanthomonas oryzae]QBH01906.1 hypothetical protein EYC56_08025 [Xanthomonas oryzae]QBH05695.1 hypothetical protein EYC57_06795 [Xanthomonas oryzae]
MRNGEGVTRLRTGVAWRTGGGKKRTANGITPYVDVAIRNKGHGDVVLEGRQLQRRAPAVRAR